MAQACMQAATAPTDRLVHSNADDLLVSHCGPYLQSARLASLLVDTTHQQLTASVSVVCSMLCLKHLRKQA